MFPTEESFINIHSHHKPRVANEFVLRNAYLTLSTEQLNNLPYATSVGLHPWLVNTMSVTDCSDMLIDKATADKVLAIGEIGIDRATAIPVQTQVQYFEAQVNIARALQKPVIIHAVKSYSDIIPFLKKSKIPFIFHQFSGNTQQANELLKHQAFFSFGKGLFEPKTEQAFIDLPLTSVFLETDIAGHINISDVYHKAAELKKLTLDELKSAVFHNFARLFRT